MKNRNLPSACGVKYRVTVGLVGLCVFACGGASAPGAEQNSDTNGGRAGAAGGATSSSQSGVGGTAAGSGGMTSVSLGACTEEGALGCSEADPSVTLNCGASGVWAVTSKCPAGTQCDSRVGTTHGTCVAPDAVCTGASGPVCLDGAVVTCDGEGYIATRSICPSQVCENGACVPWDLCHEYNGTKIVTTITTAKGGYCFETPPSVYGVLANDSPGFWVPTSIVEAMPESWVKRSVAVSSSADWYTPANCKDVRAYPITGQNIPGFRVDVPAPYWITVVPGLEIATDDDLATVLNAACMGKRVEPGWPTAIDFTVTGGASAVIATRDPSAPAFWFWFEQVQ